MVRVCKSVQRRGREGKTDPLRGSKGCDPGGDDVNYKRSETLSSSAWISKSKVCIAADRRGRPAENALLFRACIEIERDYPGVRESLHPAALRRAV